MSKIYVTEFLGLANTAQSDSVDILSEPMIVTQKIDTTATTGGIGVLGAITAGTLYTNGVYPNVPLTGGTGSGARATITVSGGGVTGVALTNAGLGYTAADALSVAAASVGGTGSGFSIPVTSITIVTAPFNALTKFIEIECDSTAPASFRIGSFPNVATVNDNRLNTNDRIRRGVPAATVYQGANTQTAYLSAITNT